MCKAHANTGCKSCCESTPCSLGTSMLMSSRSVGWKKQITKLHKEGKKAAKGKKESGTNLY